MSYVLHVWEHAAPASLDEALALHERLSAQRSGGSPKLRVLATRLVERFPCPREPGSDDLGVWTDAPLDGLTAEPVCSLGIASSATDTVVPFVVEVAQSLGLTVLDDQAGCVYLPSGACLGPGAPQRGARPAPPAATTAPSLQNKAEVQAMCQQAFRPWLEAAGFRAIRKPAAFRRQTGPVEASVQHAVTDYAPRFVIGVSVGLTIHLPEPYAALAARFADAYLLDATWIARGAGILLPGASGGFDAPATVSGRGEFDALMAAWGRLLEAGILPVLARCTTLEGLEAEVNAEPSPFRRLPSGLLLAAFLRRPGLREIAARIAGAGPMIVARQVDALSGELRALGHDL